MSHKEKLPQPQPDNQLSNEDILKHISSNFLVRKISRDSNHYPSTIVLGGNMYAIDYTNPNTSFLNETPSISPHSYEEKYSFIPKPDQIPEELAQMSTDYALYYGNLLRGGEADVVPVLNSNSKKISALKTALLQENQLSYINIPREVKLEIALVIEAATLSKLSSPYIVDFKKLVLLDKPGRHKRYSAAIEMEWIDPNKNKNLSKVLEETVITNQTFEPYLRRVNRIVRQMAEALHECEKKGIIYYDLKPDNILDNPTDKIATLVDFGLTNQRRISGAMNATPRYFAPELTSRKKEKTAQLHVHSLGMLATEMLARIHVRRFKEVNEFILTAHQGNDPESIGILSPLIEHTTKLKQPYLKSLIYTLQRSVQKEPSYRHSSVHDFAEEFEDKLLG